MSLRNAVCIALALAMPFAAGPAFAQQATGASQASGAPTAASANAASGHQGASDSDETFMTGLRRVGVMAGEVVQCTPVADRQKPIADSMALANQIAIHFGLAAAFNFSGAVGYGAGKPFDKSGCATASSGWNAITLKYLNR